MIQQLKSQFETIFLSLGGTKEEAILQPSNLPHLCDFQVNGVMSLCKRLKRNPQDLAKEIISQIKCKDAQLSVAGPGFINIKLTSKAILENLKWSIEKFDSKVLIDYSSPNVAKGMHVGHLRSTLIGAALVNMYKEKGCKVISDNHLGDFGTPMGIVLSMISETPDFSWDLETIEKSYVQGSKKYQDDNEVDFKKKVQETTVKLQSKELETTKLWQKLVDTTISSLKEDYDSLGVIFDQWKGESFFEGLIVSMMKSLKEKGLLEISEGAVVMDLTPLPPILLEKAGGGFLYATSDLACVEHRQDQDKVLYVVDKRQSLHFKQVFAAAEKAGLTKSSLEHVSFGTVNGADGRPYKTRQGEVLKLKELISQFKQKALEKINELGGDFSLEEKESIANIVGVGALKFSELKHHRETDYIFDIDKFMALEGFTGPYVLYSGVRAKSLLKKVGIKGKSLVHDFSKEERALLIKIQQSSFVFEKALKLNQPHVLCEYVYDLASDFSSFYNSTKVMTEPDSSLKSHYVFVVESFVETMEKVLSLLGMKLPEKM